MKIRLFKIGMALGFILVGMGSEAARGDGGTVPPVEV